MHLQFDPEILKWFLSWSGEFDWDEGNISKNKKHGIARFQIESVFGSPVYVAGKIMESLEEPRWLVLGETKNRGWALIVTIRGQQLRIISCRRQRKKEVQFYENFKNEKGLLGH